MSLNTYSDLKASIANWLNRDDIANEIPDFISLAESRIAHEVRLPTLEKKVLISLDTEGYTTIPVDFLEAKDVFFNDKPLERRSLAEIKSYEPYSGIPIYFAREVGKLTFFPKPTMGATDKLEMIYYQQVASLSDSAPTNVLLSTVPELYLYGSLVEAANFLGSDSSQWEMNYQTAYNRIVQHSRDSEGSGSTVQIANGY